MQKVLKKQMDLHMEFVKDKTERNQEKRRKALKVVEDKNKDIDRMGHTAFRENITSIEVRLKTMEDEEANIER
jgi:hypothetical protein